jgi:hypothetical protein
VQWAAEHIYIREYSRYKKGSYEQHLLKQLTPHSNFMLDACWQRHKKLIRLFATSLFPGGFIGSGADRGILAKGVNAERRGQVAKF